MTESSNQAEAWLVGQRRIAESLGPYYVYLLVDPMTHEAFYVGKGTGERYLHHGQEAALSAVPGEDHASERNKLARIRAIRATGAEPHIDIVRHGLEDERTAFLIEAALIDCLPHLTNKVQGYERSRGLASLLELESRYGAPVLNSQLRAVLIKLGNWQAIPNENVGRAGHGYRHSMTDEELYQAIRGVWKISPVTARNYPFAVAIHDGLTRGVWEIDHSSWRSFPDQKGGRRWAFQGRRIKEGPVFDAFVGSLGKRLPPTKPSGAATFGSGSPISYWPG